MAKAQNITNGDAYGNRQGGQHHPEGEKPTRRWKNKLLKTINSPCNFASDLFLLEAGQTNKLARINYTNNA